MSIRTAERTLASPPVAQDRRGLPRHVVVAVVALLALGTVLRIWVLVSPIGAFDSDSAVPGLMARHILHGEVPAFYWGQPYGGSLEAFAAAALFVVLPPWVVLVKLVPMAFSALAALLTWFIGRRLVGDRAAALGAAFFWAVPFTIWYSSKTGPYWSSLVLTLLCVALILRIADRPWRSGHAGRRRRRPPRWEPGLLGLCLGLAWWGNPSLLLVLPVLALMRARRLVPHWRLAWLVVVGFVIGAAPWLVFNLGHGFRSLSIGAGQPESTYAGRLEGFFTTALPMALGLRRPFTHAWIAAPVGQVAYAAALVAFVVFAVRSWPDRRLRVLFAVVAAYPFLYAASPFTWYLGQPRYLLYLLPFLALVAGRAVDGSRRRVWTGAGVSATVAVAGIALFPNVQPYASGAEMPADTASVHRLLRDHGITRAYADYWIAYRVTFESRERTIVAAVTEWRYEPFQDKVAAAPRPAYVFVADSPVLARFLAAAVTRSVVVDFYSDGRWAVVVPTAKVLPADWPEVFDCPARCTSTSSAWSRVRSPHG